MQDRSRSAVQSARVAQQTFTYTRSTRTAFFSPPIRQNYVHILPATQYQVHSRPAPSFNVHLVQRLGFRLLSRVNNSKCTSVMPEEAFYATSKLCLALLARTRHLSFSFTRSCRTTNDISCYFHPSPLHIFLLLLLFSKGVQSMAFHLVPFYYIYFQRAWNPWLSISSLTIILIFQGRVVHGFPPRPLLLFLFSTGVYSMAFHLVQLPVYQVCATHRYRRPGS